MSIGNRSSDDKTAVHTNINKYINYSYQTLTTLNSKLY